MSTQQNVKAVRDIYAAFGRGDVAFIVNQLADNVRWVSYLDPAIPWAGDFSGKANVPRFFDAIFQSMDVDLFEPQEWIAEGDTVVSIGDFGGHVRATGKKSRVRWVFLWKFQAGKVTSYEQFQDPTLAAAFR